MAGVKGRSGGARPGTGPKPRPKTHDIGAEFAKIVVEQAAVAAEGAVGSQPTQPAISADVTPLEFLLSVMRNPLVDDKLRLEAAKTAAPFMHMKKGDVGVKDEKADKAKKAAAGKFAAAAAPKLVVNNR